MLALKPVFFATVALIAILSESNASPLTESIKTSKDQIDHNLDNLKNLSKKIQSIYDQIEDVAYKTSAQSLEARYDLVLKNKELEKKLQEIDHVHPERVTPKCTSEKKHYMIEHVYIYRRQILQTQAATNERIENAKNHLKNLHGQVGSLKKETENILGKCTMKHGMKQDKLEECRDSALLVIKKKMMTIDEESAGTSKLLNQLFNMQYASFDAIATDSDENSKRVIETYLNCMSKVIA